SALLCSIGDSESWWFHVLGSPWPVRFDLPSPPGCTLFIDRNKFDARETMPAEIEQATVDAAGMRARNSALLLNLIWRERQASRADLARRTGLSPSTVSAIVGDLERSGLVRSTGSGVSRGGRRPTLLGFCDDAFAIIGVELCASHVRVVLI